MTEPTTVLIVDDDPLIAKMLRPYLDEERFRTLVAANTEEAARTLERESPAILLLDVTMPGENGLDLLRRLHGRGDVGVIVLTGRTDELDRILGLELGADDYVTKPFSPRELVSRIKAVLRRSRNSASPERDRRRIVAGDLSIDTRERSVTRGNTEISLTPTEFRILEVLASERGRAFSRAELLDRVNADALDVAERTLDSHITRLRQKLEPDSAHPRYVLTVYGHGYKFSKTA
ncbi:MAG TPA: response regulator transcription factor [Candidatus Tumulicola sp.]|nr:response regulator transcription factor [Candidatus Tumulicola sp.]